MLINAVDTIMKVWQKVGSERLASKTGGRWDVGLAGGGLSKLMRGGRLTPNRWEMGG